MKHPLISVIIPCYNSAQYISHALDAMLCQTYKNLEIIIVDDNSTDNLKAVIKPYLAKYNNIIYKKLPFDDPERFNEKGKNINAGFMARNYGVKFAKGELITFQDADDGSLTNRIEVQYKIMQEYNSCHVNVDWQQYKNKYNCKYLKYKIKKSDIIKPNEIFALAKKTKGFIIKKPFSRNKNIIKRFLQLTEDKFSLRDWSPYPCAASMPLVKRKVFKRCQFRQLYERTRPSRRGRGADRDFNFWVAETFKNSIAVKIPLILWRVKTNNPNYLDKKYVPK